MDLNHRIKSLVWKVDDKVYFQSRLREREREKKGGGARLVLFVKNQIRALIDILMLSHFPINTKIPCPIYPPINEALDHHDKLHHDAFSLLLDDVLNRPFRQRVDHYIVNQFE